VPKRFKYLYNDLSRLEKSIYFVTTLRIDKTIQSIQIMQNTASSVKTE